MGPVEKALRKEVMWLVENGNSPAGAIDMMRLGWDVLKECRALYREVKRAQWIAEIEACIALAKERGI